MPHNGLNLMHAQEDASEQAEAQEPETEDAMLSRLLAAQAGVGRPGQPQGARAADTKQAEDLKWAIGKPGKRGGRAGKKGGSAAQGLEVKSTPTPGQQGQGTGQAPSVAAQDEGGTAADTKRALRKAARAVQQQAASIPNPLSCQVCKEVFGSRTKLFAHIKATGHGVPKS